MNYIEQAINLKVKVTNLLDQPTVGYIYAYAPIHDILALRLTNNYLKGENNENQIDDESNTQDIKENYKFINTSFIKTIQVLAPFPKKASSPSPPPAHSKSSSPPPAPTSPTLVQLSINELETSLNRAIAQHKDMIQKSNNKKVSNNAIILFERLYVNFDGKVEWGTNNDCILVNSEVKVTKPYLAKSGNITKLNNDVNNKTFDRTFQIVQEFWQNIENDRTGG